MVVELELGTTERNMVMYSMRDENGITPGHIALRVGDVVKGEPPMRCIRATSCSAVMVPATDEREKRTVVNRITREVLAEFTVPPRASIRTLEVHPKDLLVAVPRPRFEHVR